MFVRAAASAGSRLREFFLLENALTKSRARPLERQRQVSTLLCAVDRRRVAARSLALPEQAPAALVLLREAIIVTARALQAERGETRYELLADHASEHDPSPEGGATLPDAPAIRELMATVTKRGKQGAAAPAAIVEALFAEGPLAFDALPPSDAQQLQADADDVLEAARASIDARSVAELRVSLAARIGAVALAVIATLTWGGSQLLRRDNIALHRVAQASSRRAHTPPSSGPAGLDPSGVVDGRKTGGYDVCTNNEVHPWVMVDLEKSEAVGKVKVYNRGDCCWGLYDLPQVLEVSENGRDFEAVAQQATAYSEVAPWVIDLGGKRARYIRVRGDASEPRELVLSEIEVFGAH